MDEEAPSVLNPIGNEEPEDTATEEQEPLVSSSSGLNDNPSPDTSSPTTLLQVNNLIQNESRALLTQLRAEIKELVRESMTVIQSEQGSAPDDDTNKVTLPKDTFSLMIVSKAGTSPWFVGFGIYALQMLLLVFVCWEMFFDGNFLAQFPLKVKLRVSIAQFFVLLAIFFLQADLVEAAKSFFVLSDDNLRVLVEGGNNIKKIRRRFVFTNILKFTMAIITIAVSVALTVRSNAILDLLIDFAALMVISQIDNLVFILFVKNGLFGLELKKKADEITTRSVIVDITSRKCRMDVLIISCIYFVSVLCWIVILFLQLNGAIARAKGCNVVLNRLGDGVCDGGLFNTEICDWDSGDCLEVNTKYPNCNALLLPKIKNGICDGGDYNTEECGWDGGDCCVVESPWLLGDENCDGGDYDTAECAWDNGDCVLLDEYPICRVPVDDKSEIGDGFCKNEAPYNTEECGWDGGDCIVPGYPDCRVNNPSRIGDGTCHVAPYNTEECGWDNGDCLQFNKYPDCRVGDPSQIGNGSCTNSAPHNTEECGWDGGDCFVPDYPNCHGVYPSYIGDGTCRNFAPYNTEECGWDGGDCKEVPGYRDCRVGDPSLIGDGTCRNTAPHNTEECGWDGGDCIPPDYPNCHGVEPFYIGDGTCRNYAPYNTEECGWDGGDCIPPDYPNCHGVDPSQIGDGKCTNSFTYNTEECGWDGGDCLN